MTKYILKRLLISLLTIWAVATVCFFLLRLLPGNPFAGQDIASQTRQSLKNVSAILEAAGYTCADVVKSTVLLADIADFAAMNAVYAEFFRENCPARAAFAVKDLPKGALVEIEVVAGR